MKNIFRKIPLFWKIWLSHIFIYYPIRALFFLFQFEEKPDFFHIVKVLLLAFLPGIYGMFERFPLMIFIQMAVMLMITEFAFRKKVASYLMTIIITNIILYTSGTYDIYCLKDFIWSFIIFLVIFLVIFRKELKN
ncbi:MAG: hypothetical protein LBE92_00630 [Chryseobacterium sp.]|jgi:hypothetical protein|uniref:hypothetical protein n=1 Tax=Chryseobacterium sp. TaxID=1871047 RepID=UPI00281E1BDE|nr:hypothetical protein [Chryseobacterium sp.]MDR2234604.1 hypothetical protein [Chryseobacterium sp.]